jgi:vancomycin permeability regulator SanA
MQRVLKILFALFSLWFALHTVAIVIDGLTDEVGSSDVGVILGNKVNEDGTLSERLQKRLDKGLELYRDSLIKQIVVSGGRGIEGHDEGSVMAEYLIANGVPRNKVIVDNAGVTTEATAKNFSSFTIKATSITIITQFYHISRTKLAFRNEGHTEVKGAHADYFESRDAYSIVREFFAYYKYLLLG